MSAIDLAVGRNETDEGFRAKKYRDPTGHETIGYGCNLDAGLTPFAAKALLVAQTTETAEALAGFWWAQGLDDVRMSVVVEIAFNLGVHGLLGYVKMLAAIGAKRWEDARNECLNSDAARLLPARYALLANLLLTG